MKTIFITVGEPVVARNIIRTRFFPALKGRLLADDRVVLIVETKQKGGYADLADGERVVVESLEMPRASRYEKALAFVARNAFSTGTNDVMQRRAYALGESSIPPFLKRTLGVVLGSSRTFQDVIRFLELRIVPSREVANLFDRYKPTLVFSTVIVNTAVDVPIVREAKRRNIRVLGMVRSWDNLTSFGFLRFLPDMFLAQNEYIKDMTARLHGMSPARISVVGLPHYDLYKDSSLVLPRESFLAQYGIAPDKKLLVYAAVGDFLFRREAEMADVLERIIAGGSLKYPAAVVYRTHPSFPMPIEKIRALAHVIPDDASQKAKGYDAFTHLINLLAHADVVVTAGSTMMIDAIAMGKPAITCTFDGVSGDSYWFSVARFHDRFTHIVELLKEGGVRLAHSEEELISAINRYLENPSADAVGQKQVVARFIAPYGGAGERLAECVAAEFEKASLTRSSFHVVLPSAARH